jgi:hypothetical protein
VLNSDCGANRTCRTATGICYNNCSANTDCLAGQSCQSGVCGPSCTANSQCANNQVCNTSNGQCVARQCSDNASCSLGVNLCLFARLCVCLNGLCVA